MEFATDFISEIRNYLSNDYLPKIKLCLEKLTDEDIWWRPSEDCNSIGNLILHLNGNITQWIIISLTNGKDERQRQQEFDERTMISKAELLARLSATIARVDTVLSEFDETKLLEKQLVQGKEVTLLHAILHATEHFSMHTGQIIYITKLRTGQAMEFYGFIDGKPIYHWLKNEQ